MGDNAYNGTDCLIQFVSSSDDAIPIIKIEIYNVDDYVGHVRLVPHSFSLYEIHITKIEDKYKGSALEISQQLIPFIFRHMKRIENLIAMIPTDNRLAIALAKRSGMKSVGVLKNSIKQFGILKDQEILSINRGDL